MKILVPFFLNITHLSEDRVPNEEPYSQHLFSCIFVFSCILSLQNLQRFNYCFHFIYLNNLESLYRSSIYFIVVTYIS